MAIVGIAELREEWQGGATEHVANGLPPQGRAPRNGPSLDDVGKVR
ncbi:MAG: hypothetical protein ABW137_23905 [Mycobacterium sp.]